MNSRHIFSFAVFFLMLCGAVGAQDFSGSEQPRPPQSPQPEQPSLDVPRSPNTRCLQFAYNRYVTRGGTARNAWNNAVRDCSYGMDMSCIDFAYKHYVSLGQSDNQAYNNSLRDCRNLLRRY